MIFIGPYTTVNIIQRIVNNLEAYYVKQKWKQKYW